MRVLGISPSFAFAGERIFGDVGISGSGHDSAAVLIHDGVVEAAIEQERLDRIKHSNKAPVEAIRFCMEKGKVGIDDIDYIAISYREDTLNEILKSKFLSDQTQENFFDARYYIHRLIEKATGKTFDNNRIIFVSHNDAHAESAYEQSGYDDCLLLVTDGMGDDSAGVIQNRRDGKCETLHTISVDNSLGLFYIHSIEYLGYGPNDEYKVMGLAPYGDPRKYRRYFNKIMELNENGQYTVHDYYHMLFDINRPRRKGERFSQVHKDIAAGIQRTLEETAFHVLEYYQKTTGTTKLCIAGGVAHNCSLNGKLARSGLFTDIFVHPAAHDAGAVLGAALFVYKKYNGDEIKRYPLKHVYWGTEIGDDREVEEILSRYDKFISYKKTEQIEKDTAKLMASGKIVGWVQGASEFGPRALGNRSILADPVPEENKLIINQMVKKRESYRPFAPSVLEEKRDLFFEMPDCNINYDFMNMVLNVKEDKREQLGAITHVDGTARIQSVSKENNEKYWTLIHEFENLTGIPILLNTSFNNNCEPIVDSVEDAIVTYLTTKLHYLVVGNYIISKKDAGIAEYEDLVIKVKESTTVSHIVVPDAGGKNRHSYFITVNFDSKVKIAISVECYTLLVKSDGTLSIRQLLQNDNLQNDAEKIIDEIIGLWEKRVIVLSAK